MVSISRGKEGAVQTAGEMINESKRFFWKYMKPC